MRTRELLETLQATQEIPWSLRAALVLLGLYIAAALRLLATPTWIPVGDLGVLLILASGLVPSLWSVRIGAALIGIATAGIPIQSHASLHALLALAAIGLPFLALIILASRLDPEAPPRPPLPSKLGLHIGTRLALLAIILLAPLALAPVRTLLASQTGPAVSVLFLAGATLAVLAPNLTDRDIHPHRIDAQTPVGENGRRSRRRNY